MAEVAAPSAELQKEGKFNFSAADLARFDPKTVRLLIGYESHNCKYSESVLYCVIHVIEDAVLKATDADGDTAFELSLRCFLKFFHDLAISDHLKILPRIVTALKLCVTKERLKKQVRICETLIDVVESSSLQNKFTKWKEIIIGNLIAPKVDVFQKIGEFLEHKLDDDALRNKRFETSIDFITCLIKEGHYFKKAFEERLSLGRIVSHLKRMTTISRSVIDSMFKLLVNGDWTPDNYCSVIANGEITCILIDLMPIVSHELQRFICETLRVMCATVNHNRIISCQYGLIGNILSLLEKYGDTLPKQILSCLISLLEILGSHSIEPKHLKQLIGLFRGNGDKKQASYSDRLLQALERMASQFDERQPRYFIDFYDPTEVHSLQASSIPKWGGKGITFHAWLCLDFSVSTPKRHRLSSGKVRHMLYSFLNSNGEGFEAFFTEKGYLVIGVCTKKEYLSTSLTELSFDDQEWHSLAVVHTKRSFGRSFVSVFVDGQLSHEAVIKYPVTEDLMHANIGYGVRHNPNFHYNLHPPPPPAKGSRNIEFPECIAAGQQDKCWGEVYMLKGQISSVQLFNETLSPSVLSEINCAGPNNWNNNLLEDAPDILYHLNEVSKHIVLHYDAKAANENVCLNLNSSSNGQMKSPTILSARVCQTWDIKSSIQCIGGLQVLFPLLEQVQYTEDTSDRIARDPSFTCPKDPLPTTDIDESNNEELPKINNTNQLNSTPLDSNHSESEVTVEDLIGTSSVAEEKEPNSKLEIVPDKSLVVSPVSIEEFGKRKNTGSFLVIDSPQTPVRHEQPSQETEDWVLVDKAASSRTRNVTFTRWAKDRDYYDLNGATFFISLLRNMLVNQKSAQDLFLQSKGVQLMGLLLQRCDPRIINVGFLMSLQSLVEGLSGCKMELLRAIHEDIMFNFRIWTESDISVRIAHVQLISTYVKDNTEYFRETFGVEFLLKVIRSHYLEKSKRRRSESSVELSQEDHNCMRMAILGLVFFYLKSGSSVKDIDALVSYISAVTDLDHLNEVMELLKHSLEVPGDDHGKLCSRLSESSFCSISTRWLVHDGNEKTRLCILRILYLLLKSNKVSDAAKAKIRLKGVGYDSVCTLLSKQSVSRDVVIALLKLALSIEQTLYKGVDVYLHFDIVFATMHILRVQPLPVKLEVALKIRNSLKSSSKSAKKCVQEAAWYEPFLQLIVVQPQDQNEISSEPDVMQEELAAVTLEIIHIAMWKGIDGSDLTVWKERGQPLAALHQMASKYNFITPVLIIERKLLNKCVQACYSALSESVQPWAVDSQNAVQVVKLVEDFLLSTEFSGNVRESQEQKWDLELLDALHELLDAMNAWEDSSEGGYEWTDALHIVERILYDCALSEDVKFVSYAAKKLHKMLSRRRITSHEEACYEIGCLNDVYTKLRLRSDNALSLFVPVFRLCFERFHELLNINKHLPDLPSLDPTTHLFEERFPEFFNIGQYVHFANQVSRIQKHFKDSQFNPSSVDIGRFWMDCLSGMDSAIKKRGHQIEESLQMFARSVYVAFEETRIIANVKQTEFETYQKYDLTTTSRLWEDTKRILTSERGAWTEREPGRTFWKLSSMENSSRMRLKLSRNFHASDHSDASRAREHGVASTSPSGQIMDLNINVVREQEEFLFSGEEDGEDIEDGVEQREPTEHLYDLNPIEVAVGKVILTLKCQLVTLMDLVPGNLELTSSHVSFYDETSDSLFGSGSDFRFPLEELQEMHMRRYNLRKSALEFFLDDRSSYFINFANEKERDCFYKKTTGQHPPNLYYTGVKSPQKLLRVSHLTQRWVRREISNFDYLMQLNTIAGRTYNDLAQYPVFPWVLSDYESDHLDLQNPGVYRDLSKPIGALNSDRLRDLQERFDNCVDPSGFQHSCHYTTHYSNAAVVLHYLIRIDPFTSLHINLQGGKFDLADRQFLSIFKTWKVIQEGRGDIREMIPEFFCFPNFLMNINNLDLGRLQSSKVSVDDVILPPWASSADDFIYKHRLALESDHVSANLHNWIDLIFGYKQKGEAAVEAYNVFHHYSYGGAVDLDSISNSADKEAIEGIINNFGQTPCQLLTKPHPVRKTVAEVAQGTNKAPRVLDRLEEVNCSLLKISLDGPPLIFIGTQKARQRSLLHHGMPDPLITIDQRGNIGFHGWLPFSEDSSGSFAFSLDPKFSNKSSRLRSSVPNLPGIWSPQTLKSPRLFALTTDGKLMICCGFWDNSIRVLNCKGKITTLLYQHLEVVTCVSLDPSGRYFISGSCDTRCMVWRIDHHSGVATDVCKRPVQTLYGHDDSVNTVAMIWELDMALSGSKDGTCIIHTIKKGQFVRSLRPESSLPHSNISIIGLSRYGRIVVNSHHHNQEEEENTLTMYGINGNLISRLSLSEAVLDMLIVEDKLVTGGERGTLAVRDVHKMDSVLVAKNLQNPIHTVAVTPDGSHIFAGRDNGTVIVVGP